MPSHYFVSCVETDGRRRSSLLAGPYASHAEALSKVHAVSRLAEDADPRAAWYAFGTAGADVAHKTVFGIV